MPQSLEARCEAAGGGHCLGTELDMWQHCWPEALGVPDSKMCLCLIQALWAGEEERDWALHPKD